MDSRPLPPGWVSQYDHNYKRYYFVDTTKQPPVSTWDDPRDASQPQSSTQSQGLYPPPQDNQYNSPSFPQPQPYLSPQSSQSYPQRPHSYHGESQSFQPQPYSSQPYQSSQSGAPKKKKKNIWDKLGLGKFGSSSSTKPGNIGSSANYGSSGKKHNLSSMALGGLGGAAGAMLLSNSFGHLGHHDHYHDDNCYDNYGDYDYGGDFGGGDFSCDW